MSRVGPGGPRSPGLLPGSVRRGDASGRSIRCGLFFWVRTADASAPGAQTTEDGGSLKELLRLQQLDLQIEALKDREAEIPRQKSKFEIHRKRLAAELAEREEVCKRLVLEQRELETDIEAKQAQAQKYDQQLFAIKKNEEYQALLHEIDLLKKQVGLREERVIAIMMELDNARARLDEDRKRIDAELQEVERQTAIIDAELAETRREREGLETQRSPLVEQVAPDLLARYRRIRTSKKTGPAVVALNDEVCSGCHMRVPPQVVNELMAGSKLHACAHCGRLLYFRGNFQD